MRTFDRRKPKAKKVQLAINAESDGINPEVRETMALLDKARWDLANCVVRAPTDGYVPNLTLKPGQMATPLPLNPLMVFVSDEAPPLIAMFPQNVMGGIEPGLEAEIAFKSRPGQMFKAHVRNAVMMIREGELDVSGTLLSGTPENVHGQVPVVFDYDEDLAAEGLHPGALGTVAIYTHRLHRTVAHTQDRSEDQELGKLPVLSPVWRALKQTTAGRSFGLQAVRGRNSAHNRYEAA